MVMVMVMVMVGDSDGGGDGDAQGVRIMLCARLRKRTQHAGNFMVEHDVWHGQSWVSR